MSNNPESYNCSADCLHIDIGCPVFIQCQGLSERIKTQLVGLYPGQYLIVSTPALGGLPEGISELIVRYVYRGEVLGFKSRVIERIERPFELIFLSYPKAVERLNLRKSSRIPCNLPATALFGKGELAGILIDLSSGGCRFVSRLEGKPQQGDLMPGSLASITFALPGTEGKMTAKCTIRNANISKEKIELGLQFSDITGHQKEQIDLYVNHISLFAAD